MAINLSKTFYSLRYVLAGLVISLAVGTAVTQARAALPGQTGNAPRCTAKAVGARDSAFKNSASGAYTTVKFKVTGPSNCRVQLSANSFYAPSMNGKPYDKQILMKRVTKTFKPGSYSMTVALPTKSTPAKGCFYQVDLTYGVRNHTPVLAYGHGKVKDCGKKPAPAPKPQLSCVSLSRTGTGQTYTFVARAQAKNTKITKYVFKVTDGKDYSKVLTLKSSSNRVTTDALTLPETGTRYTATVAVSSKDVNNKTSNACKVILQTPKQDECKPGIPVGDERCADKTEYCLPNIPVGNPECEPKTETPEETPEELPVTGAGSIIGAVLGASSAGGALHYFFRRKFNV